MLNEVIETLKETNKLLINQKYKLQYELDMLDNKIDKATECIKIAEEVEPCANNFCILRDKLKNILEGEDDTREED